MFPAGMPKSLLASRRGSSFVSRALNSIDFFIPIPEDLPIGKYRKLVPLVISIVLTVLIGYIIYRDVPDWGGSFDVMIQGRPLFLLAGLFFVFLHMFLRAARWGALLTTAKPDIQFSNLVSLTLIKYVINLIPPRSGEFAASVLLAKKEKISSTTVIAASVFERILDLISVFIIFAFYIVALSAGARNSQKGDAIILSIRSYSIKGVFLFGIGFLILLLLLRNAHWAARIPSKIRKPVLGFLEGFRALQSHGVMLRVALLSLAIWLCIMLQLWFLLKSYMPSFPLAGTALIVVLTAAGVAIPTPGGVGGYQYFMSLALINFFGRHLSPADPHTQAAGISNACYIVSAVPVIIAGLVLLNREGLSLGRISRIRENDFET
jgi:glycosyltransferase 2 family protein